MTEKWKWLSKAIATVGLWAGIAVLGEPVIGVLAVFVTVIIWMGE